MTALIDLPDRIVLALCIWGESRSEPLTGQVAVACVVRNRLKRAADRSARWRDVCLAPSQFSCFNADDPNAGPIARAAVNLMTSLPTPELHQALWVADGAMSGAAKDTSNGSTHYLTTALLKSAPPMWAKGHTVLAVIGAHSFLNVA